MQFIKKMFLQMLHGNFHGLDKYSHHRMNMYGPGAIVVRERGITRPANVESLLETERVQAPQFNVR